MRTNLFNTDTLLGAAGAIGASFLLMTSYRESASVFVLPGDAPPFLVPQLFLYFLLALSIAILVIGLLRGGAELNEVRWGLVGLTMAVMVAATVLMPELGFLVVSPVAFVLSVILLGYRRPIAMVLSSLGVSGGLYLLLVKFAQMPLPKIPGLDI